jgi:glycosyltransferase involved in cell wall biosynthesis
MSQQNENYDASRGTVFLVGPQPPPVHGMAMVNAALAQRLREAGFTLHVVDTAPARLGRGFSTRIGRLVRVFAVLGRLAAKLPAGPAALCYISVSGGFGQLYEGLFALLARCRGAGVVLHHHSFRYIERPAWRTRLLCRAAGNRAIHVALCPGMAERISGIYRVSRVQALSNAVWMPPAAAPDSGHRLPERLGYLGNLMPEKGIDTAIDLAERLGAPYSLSLAGPFASQAFEARVQQRVAALDNVELIGPRYGPEKDAFLNGIDVLLLPSESEAEPLVVLEAMARGIPVLASDAGCLPHLVAVPAGLTTPPGPRFVAAAAAQLAEWSERPERFAAACAASSARFAALQAESEAALEDLLEELLHA